MQIEIGSVLEGKVTGITKFGAFVSLPEGKTGMVHISEISDTYVKEVTDHIQENQVVKVKVLAIDDRGRIGLSMKQAEGNYQAPPKPQNNSVRQSPRDARSKNVRKEPATFEDMMLKYKQESEEKISDLKRGLESKRGGFSRRGSSLKY